MTPDDIRIGRDTHLLVPEGGCFDISERWRSRAFAERSPASAVAIRRETTLPATMWVLLTLGPSRQRRFRQGSSANEAIFNLDEEWTIAVRIDETGRMSGHIQPAAK